jgi:hypothetical protein
MGESGLRDVKLDIGTAQQILDYFDACVHC